MDYNEQWYGLYRTLFIIKFIPYMYLIQILLPLYDNDGKLFSSNYYDHIKQELTEVFGGITMHTRAPAKGLWKDEDKTIRDEIVIFEITTAEINENYWKAYKLNLEKTFLQEEIVIRAINFEML